MSTEYIRMALLAGPIIIKPESSASIDVPAVGDVCGLLPSVSCPDGTAVQLGDAAVAFMKDGAAAMRFDPIAEICRYPPLWVPLYPECAVMRLENKTQKTQLWWVAFGNGEWHRTNDDTLDNRCLQPYNAGVADVKYRMVRVRVETHEALVALYDAIHRVGVEGLPPGVRARVDSLGDTVDLAVRMARRVIGKV